MDIAVNSNDLKKYVIHVTLMVFELCKCGLKHLFCLYFIGQLIMRQHIVI